MGTTVHSVSESSPQVSSLTSHHQLTMAELGLKKKEIDAIDFAFDVYDFKGDGKVDAFYAGDLIRACNLNPTPRPSPRSEAPPRRARRCSPRPMCSPCTRPARTPRTREASTTSLRS